MSDWNAGYVSDVEYTHGYYQELNPLRVKLAFLNHGLVFPEMGTACELGFGQGVSTNFHAAGSITQWCGTDFNPTQAGFAQEDKSIAKAKKECERLNAHLVKKARGGAEVSYLVSPVTGEGVQVDRFKQLFLLARAQGAKQSGDWADFVWNTISAQGQKLIKDGETLERDEENLLELRQRAAEFDEKHLPVLKALQIA